MKRVIDGYHDFEGKVEKAGAGVRPPPLARVTDSVLWCCYCDFRRPCGTLEEAEFFVVRHVTQEHGKTVVSRWDRDAGHLTEIPQ